MSTTPPGPLFTDLYQLTMAAGYWRLGRHEERAAFHLFFRRPPFGGGYAVAAGLGSVVEWLRGCAFGAEDLACLAAIPGNDGRPIFAADFLAALGELRLTCDVDAVPEGTAVFAHEPLVRVVGPLWQAQLLETALLNLVNFPTLIATKAARVVQAAGGDDVLEFGLRRAQGVDGALTASRAAYLGGCAATSNVLAGQRFGIPVRGTHAHSWVMSFDDEAGSFEAYAEAMPNNCVFLVDTYDTLEGVRRAIEVGKRLRERGHEMVGVRLDSGDLAHLSKAARALLDEAGFPDAKIVASNDLDERLIASLKQQGAAIAVWGVGTRLVTAYDQPALGGVYKLGALRASAGAGWSPRLKLSETTAKVSIPGVLNTRRYRDAGTGAFVADAIYDETLDADALAAPTVVDPGDAIRRKAVPAGCVAEDLLVPVLRGGAVVYDGPTLEASRARAAAQLAALDPAVRRFEHPHAFPAGLVRPLHDRRQALIEAARASTGPEAAAEQAERVERA